MDFKQLQDDVLDYCQELQGSVGFTLTRVKNQINRGYYDFVRRTKCIQTEVTVDTVANQFSYQLDPWFYKIEHVRYIEDASADVLSGSASEIGEVLHPYPGGFASLPKNKEYGNPTWYWVRAADDRTKGEIGTVPIVNTSSYTIKIWLSIFPQSDMSTDATVPRIKEAWQDALVHFAVWKLFDSYSHLNAAYLTKSLNHKQQYFELVVDANENMFIGTDDVYPQVQDSYFDYDI